MCVALDTIRRASGHAARELSVERVADGFRIRTVPAEAHIVDGMGLVFIDRAGRVRSAVLGDSL